MYRKVESSPKMSMHEASGHYPDDYILLQMEDDFMLAPVGTVVYVGDDFSELFALQVDLPVPRGTVFEGLNLQRRHSMGGIALA